jgi:hypothetical protein
MALLQLYADRRARLEARRDALLARAAATPAGDAGGQAETIAELAAAQRRIKLDTAAFAVATARCTGAESFAAFMCAAFPWVPPLASTHAALGRMRAARAALRSGDAAGAAPAPGGAAEGAQQC